MASLFKTLAELLQERQTEEEKGIYFIDGLSPEVFLSYSELFRKSVKVLAILQRNGLRPGQELVIQIDDNQDFLLIFWACLLGGIIPVPLATGKNDEHRQKIFNIWPLLNDAHVVITSPDLERMGAFAAQVKQEGVYAQMREGAVIMSDIWRDNISGPDNGILYDAKPDDIAFVQFSSGSTGTPKGVVLTHKNLLANIDAISIAAEYRPRDAMLSWMPLTHDMGLIGFHINPLFSCMDQYLIPTSLFVRRPALWLEKASQYRVTILGSPNFGYEYLLRHSDASSGGLPWDLGSVRLIYNGAEPIAEKLARNFLDTLAVYGLKSYAMCPVYGLAEGSLAVSISGLRDEIISRSIRRDHLGNGDRVEPASDPEVAVSFVNVGKAISYCQLRITADPDQEVPDEVIGHVQIKGDNVTTGYYNNPRETEKVFTIDGWLKTGDLGFISQGALYITGRAKDIIFLNGQNYYAHDIERIAQEIEGVELNKVVAAGYFNDRLARESVVLFLLQRGSVASLAQTALLVKEIINRKTGIVLDSIVPVTDISRTTSGKLQRFRLLQQYLAGAFEEGERALALLMGGVADGNAIEAGLDDGPLDEYEQTLVEIWTIILEQPVISLNADFFSLGGNSLKAAELSMLVWKRLKTELPVDTIYRSPTIRALAAVIKQLTREEYIAIPLAAPAEPSPLAARYPLTPMQKRLFYAWELNKGGVSYNIPIAIRLHGVLNIELAERCIIELIERHEILRSVFVAGIEPQFSIAGKIDFRLERLVCCGSEVDEQLRQLVEPFDLLNDCLIRAAMIQTGEEDHILFLDMHHIIADGISVRILIQEFLQLYEGRDLVKPRVEFKDFTIAVSRGWRYGHADRQESYWLKRLEGDLPVLELPLDHPRPPVFDPGGGQVEFMADPLLTARLKKFALHHGCSVHVLLFALYNILLSKYSGQRDIIVGIPVANRRHPDLTSMMGLFVNNLAIRSQVKDQETFIQWLTGVQRDMQQALENQEYPFDDLVRSVQTRKDAGRNPLFDTMFLYQNIGFPVGRDSNFHISHYPFDAGCSKFDLSLEVFEQSAGISKGEADKLTFRFEYATALFEKETISRLAGHFGVLLNRVLEDPSSRIADLGLLGADEKDVVLRQFNQSNADYPKEKTIIQLIREQADRTPGAVALEFDAEQWNYGQLLGKVEQVAGLLHDTGVKPGVIVLVFLPRSPQMILALLSILAAGGTYLPVEPDAPMERIRYLASNSRSSLLIAVDETAERLKEATLNDPMILPPGIRIINIDRLENSKLSDLNQEDLYQATPVDPAYVIYTSGTTGKPKGVVIANRSLVNYSWWALRMYASGAPASYALYTSLSFDLTVTSIFVPLISGGTIVIYGQQDFSLIEKVVKDNRSTIFKATPSHLRSLLQGGICGPLSDSRVRKIIVGGEKLDSRLACEIYQLFNGKAEIFNEYGPTEATVGCMIHPFDPLEKYSSVPIGIPAANTRIYLLDNNGQPVPTGVPGELFIAGDGLATGYLYQEDLTKQRFLPDPFRTGMRMYKTGDIARRLPDGKIEYIGRADLQVKINGYRIEPAEIEDAMLGIPDVSAVLINVIDPVNAAAGKMINAYYCSGQEILPSTWRSFLASRLPHYMIPVSFIRIPSIPLTKNGKVDYEALPAPAQKADRTDGAASSSDSEMELSPLETICMAAWEDILGQSRIHVFDNFYELGGDSIKAAQLSFRLSENGVTISPRHIMTYQVIRDICTHATHAMVTSPGSLRYEQGLLQGDRALTPIETWFFSQQFEDEHCFNQYVQLGFKRDIDLNVLQDAFRTLVRHHDGLRTNYDPVNKRMFYNHRHLEELLVVMEGAVITPRSFDITRDLLLHVEFFRDDSPYGMIRITAHHLLIDGISWRILLEDLYTVYTSLEKGRAVTLKRKTASLTDREKELTAYAKSAEYEKLASYWDRAESFEWELPGDNMMLNKMPHSNLTKDCRSIRGALSKEDTQYLLKEATRTFQTDLPTLLNVAWVRTLKEWTGLDRFVIEQETHGRLNDGWDSSRTIGWFTSMFPLLLDCPEGTLGDQIRTVREQMRAVPSGGIGYGIRKYWMNGGPEGLEDRQGTVCRYNYLGQFDKEFDNELFTFKMNTAGFETSPLNRMTARLEIVLMILHGSLMVEIKYNGLVHTEDTMNRLKDNFFKHIGSLSEYIHGGKTPHFTPADFDADLNQQELDELFQ